MKTLIKMLSVTGLITFTTLASSAITANQAHAYSCKTVFYNGAVVQKKKIGGRYRAKKDWEKRMKNQFGYTWASWSIAKNKSIKCYKPGNDKPVCIARAKPCQYVAG